MALTVGVNNLHHESYAFVISVVLISLIGFTLFSSSTNGGGALATSIALHPSPAAPASVSIPPALKCGNNVCGAGEDVYSCPADCAKKTLYSTYPGYNNFNLVANICQDSLCQSVSSFTVTSNGGLAISAWAPDGLPIFLHQTAVNTPVGPTLSGLDVSKCRTASCSTISHASIVSTTFLSGTYYSLSVNAQNVPWIYYAPGNGTPGSQLFRCLSSDCSSVASPVLFPGVNVSMAIGQDDLPILVHDAYNTLGTQQNELYVEKCDNADCSLNHSVFLDGWAYNGSSSARPQIILGPDGNPYIVYNGSQEHLKLIRCDTPDCGSFTVLANPSKKVIYSAIGFLQNKSPIVAFYHDIPFQTTKNVLLICSDSLCSAHSTIDLPGKPGTGANPSYSVSMASDGKPIIGYNLELPSGNDQFTIVKCLDALCQTFSSTQPAVGIGYQHNLST